jgi:hypothetical protein
VLVQAKDLQVSQEGGETLGGEPSHSSLLLFEKTTLFFDCTWFSCFADRDCRILHTKQ